MAAGVSSNLVNTVMLESGMQSYVRVINGVVQYEQAAMSAAQALKALEILNAETGKVAAGVSSRQESLRRAVQNLAEAGLTGFVDRGGRNWAPETYVNMAIRTTCGNIARDAVFARNADYGNDLVWVRTKSAARPLCYPWQGKIISMTNRSGYVEDLHGEKHRIYPVSETSYGEPAGLWGINCGHVPPNPFIPGGSLIRGKAVDEKANAEAYQESQKQRAIERKIRKAKRESAALEEAGLDASAAGAKVRKYQAEMRDFIEQTGRTRRRDREQIFGADSDAAARAVTSAENRHKQWLKFIGAEDSGLKTLDKYYDAKYSNSPEYSALRQYAKGVQTGWISPLSGFGNFKKLQERVENEIVGRTTAAGIKVTGQSKHFMQRVLGTAVDPQKLADQKREIRRSGVSVEDVKNALFSPVKILPSATREDGLRSIKFVGEKCEVTLNPDTGNLIQTNPKKQEKKEGEIKC